MVRSDDMNIKARLARLEARLGTREDPSVYYRMPFSELLLGLLQCSAELFFARGPADVVGRLRAGIAYLEEYRARGGRSVGVERLCTSWVYEFDEETGRGAFIETDIARVMRECEQQERGGPT
jgi:hypothetical protein